MTFRKRNVFWLAVCLAIFSSAVIASESINELRLFYTVDEREARLARSSEGDVVGNSLEMEIPIEKIEKALRSSSPDRGPNKLRSRPSITFQAIVDLKDSPIAIVNELPCRAVQSDKSLDKYILKCPHINGEKYQLSIQLSLALLQITSAGQTLTMLEVGESL